MTPKNCNKLSIFVILLSNYFDSKFPRHWVNAFAPFFTGALETFKNNHGTQK